MASLGKLVVILEANIAQFTSELSKASYMANKQLLAMERSVNNLKSSFNTLAKFGATALGVSSLTGGFKSIVEYERDLVKASERLGTTAEMLSSFGGMARKAGMDQDSFTMALQRMMKNASVAALGIEQGTGKFDEFGEEIGKGGAAFRELGINAQEFIKIPLDLQLKALSQRLLEVENPADRARLTLDIFGRTGGGMIALLKGGPEVLQQLIDRHRELGGVIGTDMAQRGAAAATAIGDLKIAWSSFARELTDKVAPATTRVLHGLTQMMIAAREGQGFFTLFYPEKTFAAWKALGAKMPWPFSWEKPPLPSAGPYGEAAETFFGIPLKVYDRKKRGLGEKPGGALGKIVKTIPFTEVTLFEQLSWGAEDAEKAIQTAGNRLNKLTESQELLLKGQKDSLTAWAEAVPFLDQQLGYKRQILDLEKQLAEQEIQRRMLSGEITQEIADQLRGYQAMVIQARHYALTMKGLEVGGPSAGLYGWAVQRQTERLTRGYRQTMEGMKGLETWISRSLAHGIIGALRGKKTSFEEIGWEIAEAFISKVMEGMVTKVFDVFSDIILQSGEGILGYLSSGSDLLLQSGEGIFNFIAQGAQMLLNATSGILDFISGIVSGIGGVLGIFHQGGLITAHGGLLLGADERLVKAQVGEGILSRRAMAALGPEIFAQLNQGRLPAVAVAGGGETYITVNHAPTIYVHRDMSQADWNRQAKKMTRALDRALSRRGK